MVQQQRLVVEPREYGDDEFATIVARVLLGAGRRGQADGYLVTHAENFQQMLTGAPWVNEYAAVTAFIDANGGRDGFARRLTELMWRWHRLGFVNPVVYQNIVGGFGFAPSALGREVLTGALDDEAPLLATDGVAREILRRCPDIDETVVEYLNESQGCLEAGRHRAAVVMVGAASEFVIAKLADELLSRRATLTLTRRPSEKPVALLEWTVSSFREKGTIIGRMLREHRQSDRWVTELPTKLGSLDALRQTRNDSGHPTRVRADRQSARVFLVSFIPHAQAIHETTTAIAQLPLDAP